jgi:cell division protease FtsH
VDPGAEPFRASILLGAAGIDRGRSRRVRQVPEAELTTEQARAVVRAAVQLVDMARRALGPEPHTLTTRLRAHLQLPPDGDVPNTAFALPVMEHANLQLALDELAAAAASFDVLGLPPDISHYGGVSLAGMAAGHWHGPGEPSARSYVDVDIGTDRPLPCLRAGLVLTEHGGRPVAVMLYLSEQHGPVPEVRVEVVAADATTLGQFVADLHAAMEASNVMRGKVMTFSFGRYGEFGMTFTTVERVARAEVIIPADDLAAIERHAIGISEHREALLAAGRHVKRGLLLYGPPGTGKTHTVTYLLGQTIGRTTVILSGASVGAVGQAGKIARSLQPATIVIEDVDLIGMDRTLPGGDHNAMLFQLLNEMDGLAADADVLFVLTTNRVDMLEPALAARPGRIDQAIEIGLPDADARRRLLDLYVPEPLSPTVVDHVVTRTDGVAASFIKELARRAVLATLQRGGTLDDQLEACLTELHAQAAPVLRRSLAAEPLPPDDLAQPGTFRAPGGWAPFGSP